MTTELERPVKVTSPHLAQVTLLLLSNVEEAPWNVNVMPPETFEALLTDMKAAGLAGTGPIDTAVVPGFAKRIVIDGAHRLRAAKKLGWKHLFEIFHHEIDTEEQARIFNYRRDAERGDIDDFKLASSFEWFSQKGLTQEQIAERFGVDKTTVSRKLSLLDIDPGVRQKVLAKKGFGTSHLEPIATLPTDLQEKAVQKLQSDWTVRDMDPGATVSVRVVERVVQQVKQEAQRLRVFNAAVEKAKFPKCPTCDKPPKLSWVELPRVACSSGEYSHEWSLNTGKLRSFGGDVGRPAKVDRLPQHVKSSHTVQEFNEAIQNFARKQLANVTSVEYMELNGKMGPVTFELQCNRFGEDGADVSFTVKGKEVWGVSVRKNETDNKTFKTYIEGRAINSQKDLVALEEHANSFLASFLPLRKKMPRGISKR